MISNIITPPDRVGTILIIDAAQAEVHELAHYFRTSNQAYNIYLYSNDMNELTWLKDIYELADVVLQADGSPVPALGSIKFGPNEKFKQPLDYFNK